MSKKFLSLFLAGAMALSMSSMALASDFSEDFEVEPGEDGVIKVTEPVTSVYGKSLEFGDGYTAKFTFDTSEMLHEDLFALTMGVNNSGKDSLVSIPDGKGPDDYNGLYRTEAMANFQRGKAGSPEADKILWNFMAAPINPAKSFPIGEVTVTYRYYNNAGKLACDVNVKAGSYNETITVNNFGSTADSYKVGDTTYNYKHDVSGEVLIETVGGPRYVMIFPTEGKTLKLIVKSYTSPLEVNENGDSDDSSKSEEELRQEAAVNEVQSEISNTLNVVAQAASGDETAKADLAKLPTATVTVNGSEIKAPVVTFDADLVPNVPYTVLDNLAGQKLVLKVTFGGETYLIYCGNMPKTAANRVYYTAADLVKLFAVK